MSKRIRARERERKNRSHDSDKPRRRGIDFCRSRRIVAILSLFAVMWMLRRFRNEGIALANIPVHSD